MSDIDLIALITGSLTLFAVGLGTWLQIIGEGRRARLLSIREAEARADARHEADRKQLFEAYQATQKAVLRLALTARRSADIRKLTSGSMANEELAEVVARAHQEYLEAETAIMTLWAIVGDANGMADAADRLFSETAVAHQIIRGGGGLNEAIGLEARLRAQLRGLSAFVFPGRDGRPGLDPGQ